MDVLRFIVVFFFALHDDKKKILTTWVKNTQHLNDPLELIRTFSCKFHDHETGQTIRIESVSRGNHWINILSLNNNMKDIWTFGYGLSSYPKMRVTEFTKGISYFPQNSLQQITRLMNNMIDEYFFSLSLMIPCDSKKIFHLFRFQWLLLFILSNFLTLSVRNTNIFHSFINLSFNLFRLNSRFMMKWWL